MKLLVESPYRTSDLISEKGVILVNINLNPDLDSDGVLDEDDNCVTFPNPEQTDLDQDGVGDLCDNDTDGDVYTLFYETSCDSSDADATSLPVDNDLI